MKLFAFNKKNFQAVFSMILKTERRRLTHFLLFFKQTTAESGCPGRVLRVYNIPLGELRGNAGNEMGLRL
jgi:hypothetical protein